MLAFLGAANQVVAAEPVPPEIIFGAAFSLLILVLSGVSWQIARSRAEARKRAAEDRSVAQQGEAARAAEVQAEREAHQAAIAEAIRREPSLGTSDSPETLARLAEAAGRIREEMRAQEARQIVREREERVAAEEDAGKRRRAAAEAAAAEARKAAEARRIEQAKAAEAQAEWLDSLPGWRRWIASNRGLTATLAVVLVVGIVSVGIVLQMDREEQARLAQEAAAAQAEAEADLAAAKSAAASRRDAAELLAQQIANCSADALFRISKSDEVISMARCPNESIGLDLLQRSDLPMEALAELAANPSATVRLGVARYNVSGNDAWTQLQPIVMSLADDQDALVRRVVASRVTSDDVETVVALASDPDPDVVSALIKQVGPRFDDLPPKGQKALIAACQAPHTESFEVQANCEQIS